MVRRLGPHLVGRDESLEAYREYLAKVAPATSKDTIPGEVRNLVHAHRQRLGLEWRELQRRTEVSLKEFVGNGSHVKKGFRRSTIARLAQFFQCPELAAHAESDVFWDTVVAIEPAGVEETFDLTVADDHNFVADGIVVHNSHSTAYALIAYQTAYLKAHYPVEFMAALLSGDIPGRNFKSKDSLVEHLEDCRRMEVEVVPPDVNSSEADFAVVGGRIHFGLSAIKACGSGAAEAIARERKSGGPFRSLFDFCERVDPQQCNRSTIESLIKAGAFDSMGARRAQLMAAIDRAIQSGAAAAADRRSGQRGLFGGDEEENASAASVALPNVPEFPEKERLAMEKEVLGFYLTSHPLAEHEAVLRTYCSHTSTQLAKLEHRTEVLLGGLLAAIKFSHTKNPRPGSTNTKYAMWDLEDLDGIMRCILWPEQFAEFGELVQPDAILAIRGSVDRRPGTEEVNLIVNELIPLADLPARFTSGISVRVREAEHGPVALEKLREIVRGYPGTKPLKLHLALADGGSVTFDCPNLSVTIDPELRRRIEDLLGPANFKFIPSAQRSAPPPTNGRRAALARG